MHGDGPDEPVLDALAGAIETRGWAVLDAAVACDVVDALAARALALPDAAWQAAGLGRARVHDQAVRGDRIHWIDPDDPAGGAWLSFMDGLRLGLNRRLMLGLFDCEAHLARYQPGARYGKHRDALVGGEGARVLSTVLYLDRDWSAADGGALVLYADDDSTVEVTVAPAYGRLVAFLSQQVPHEVLPTRRARHSVAGWLRRNASHGGRADPSR